MAKMETLTDGFASNNGHWAVFGTVTFDGQLKLQSNGASVGYDTLFDLTDSYMLVEYVAQNTSQDQFFTDPGNGANGYNFQRFGTGLYPNVQGTAVGSGVTFNAVNHRWLRIRHSTSANLVYWETSPDGVTWTVIASQAPTIDLTAVRPSMYSAGTGQSVWDNFNITGVDTTAPAAPTGLVATPGANLISLDWANNTEPDLNATPYLIERKTGAGGTYAQIATSVASNYTDVGLVTGREYYYRVRARDSQATPNVSAYSSEVNATIANGGIGVDAIGTNDLLYPAAGISFGQPGVSNRAIELTGGAVNAGPVVLNATGLVNQTGFAVEAWLNMPVLTDGATLFTKHRAAGSSGNYQYGMGVDANGSVWAYIGDVTSYKYITSAPGLADANKWHLYGLEWNGTTVHAYLDGKEFGTPLATTGPAAAENSGMFSLGFEEGFAALEGRIDEPAFYPTPIGASRHLAHYAAGASALAGDDDGMSFADYIISRGPRRFYPLTDATGSSTIDDQGTDNIAGTPQNGTNSPAALGAAGFVNGLATCWQGHATQVRGWQLAAAGALAFQTYTLGVWYQPVSGELDNGIMVGRQNGWQVKTNASSHGHWATTGIADATVGNNYPVPDTTGGYTLGTPHLAGLSYDGVEVQVWLDGERAGYPIRGKGLTLAAFTNAVVIGNDNSAFGPRKLSGAFIFDRVLHPAEWASAFARGYSGATPTQPGVFNLIADGDPLIAASAIVGRCEECGGHLRLLEEQVNDPPSAPVRYWHKTCHQGFGRHAGNPPASPTASTTRAQWDAILRRGQSRHWMSYVKGPTPDQKYRFDPTNGFIDRSAFPKPAWPSTSGPYTAVDVGFYGGFAGGLGIAHRFGGGGRFTPELAMIRRIMSYLMAHQYSSAPGTVDGTGANAQGYYFGRTVDHLFTMFELPVALIAVWPDLTAAERTSFLTSVKAGADGAYQNEFGYYINGNEELGKWMMCLHMEKLLTLAGDAAGAATWASRTDNQLAFACNPPGRAGTGAGGSFNGTQYLYGLYKITPDYTTTSRVLGNVTAGIPAATNLPNATLVTDPMSMNATTDGCFFAEFGYPGFYPNGGIGYSPNYLDYQASIAATVYLVHGNEIAHRLLDCMGNKLLPRVNKTNSTVTSAMDGTTPVPPWNYDRIGGSREEGSSYPFIAPFTDRAFAALQVKSGRSIFTAQQLADQWPVFESDMWLNTTLQAPKGFYRGVMGLWCFEMMASPAWPGMPS